MRCSDKSTYCFAKSKPNDNDSAFVGGSFDCWIQFSFPGQFPQSRVTQSLWGFFSQGAHAIGAHVYYCLRNEDIFAYEEHEIPLNCGGNKTFNPLLPQNTPPPPRDPFNFHLCRVLGPHTFVLFDQCY